MLLLMLLSYQNKSIHICVMQDKTPEIQQTISFIRKKVLRVGALKDP